MTDVSVTLVLYNSAEHLSSCLTGLRPALEQGVAEVIAVDNASPDASAEILTSELPQATLIRSERNRGFAGACNLAWSSVKGRYWLLLNPDVELSDEGLRKLVALMDKHAWIGAASPWLRAPGGGDLVNPGRAFPSIARALLEITRLHRALPAAVRGKVLMGPYLPRADQDQPAATDWIPGTAMIVRPDAVRAAGLLDDQFFLYGEDLEWCWRLKRAGWGVATYRSVVALHHERSSTVRTWSPDAADALIAKGIASACAVIRGPAYARAYVRLMAFAQFIEACHPGRSPDSRRRAAAMQRAWTAAIPTR